MNPEAVLSPKGRRGEPQGAGNPEWEQEGWGGNRWSMEAKWGIFTFRTSLLLTLPTVTWSRI